MKRELEASSPEEIERRSFAIIARELGDRVFPEDQAEIVMRCIHTSADFDYADTLCFSPEAVKKAREAIRRGAWIVTDTRMACAGINQRALERFGIEARCFMTDPDVAKAARQNGTTRAAACMDKASRMDRELILAVGNAPTALVRICELIEEGVFRPALVIGTPVGFVNVVQSKEWIMQAGVPYIVARGRKGGSSIAACICNAILYGMQPGK